MRPDKPFGELRIPRLPANAKLPVQALANAAFIFRGVFMQLAEGKPLDEINEERGQYLLICNQVIDAWCDHFGIPDDDESDDDES